MGFFQFLSKIPVSAKRSQGSTMKHSLQKSSSQSELDFCEAIFIEKRKKGALPPSSFSRVKIPLDRSDGKAVGSILAIFIENSHERKFSVPYVVEW